MWSLHQVPLVLQDFLSVWRSLDGFTFVPGAATVIRDCIFALYLFTFQFCTMLIQLSGLESEMLFRLYALNEDGNREINQLIDQSISASTLLYGQRAAAALCQQRTTQKPFRMSKLYQTQNLNDPAVFQSEVNFFIGGGKNRCWWVFEYHLFTWPLTTFKLHFKFVNHRGVMKHSTNLTPPKNTLPTFKNADFLPPKMKNF